MKNVTELTRLMRKHPVGTIAVALGVGYVARTAHVNTYLPGRQKIPLLNPSKAQRVTSLQNYT